MENNLKLTKEQAAFYKDIDVKTVVGDKLCPEFEHKGITVLVRPYDTYKADVVPLQNGVANLEHVLTVHNVPGTAGLNAEAVLSKVVAAAKVQHKYAEESQHFIMYWAKGATDWEVTTVNNKYVKLEARSPDGDMYMVLTEIDDSTRVRINMPKGVAGVQLTVYVPMRRDPISLSEIVRKALASLEQGNFEYI